MGSVIPIKKSANSAYLDLKNLLDEKIGEVEKLIELKLDSKVGLIPMDKPVNTCVSYNDQHQLAKELASLAVSLEKDVQPAVYTHIHNLIELLRG